VALGVHKLFYRFTQRRDERLFGGIKSSEELHAIMRRERCRVDRNSHAFSLAVFKVGSVRNNGSLAGCLAEVLNQRMRATDEAGWFDSEHIAVVLDHTWAKGAWKFAASISDMVAAKATRPEFRVYTYSYSPSDDDGDDHDSFSNRRTDDHFRFGSTEKYAGRTSSVVVSGEQGIGSEMRSGDSLIRKEFHNPAERLEPFLVRRMPAYKRITDIIGSLLGIIILSPFFAIIALLIQLVSPGPVFFKQERMGYLGKRFKMWKFRTMKVGADQEQHQRYLADLIKSGAEGSADSGKSMKKLENDSRIIPLGNFMRKTAIDELPQLFNVLRGDMSLIGPRPPIPYEVKEYHRWHYGRFDTVPGMTGLWQVSGKNRTTFKEMVRFDITYARGMSWRLDARILAGTIPAIVTQIKDTL